MDREIKVIKCGEQQGCEFDDQVSIEFEHSALTDLLLIFKRRAEIEENYDQQGRERERCELFTAAREMWEKARRGKDT